MIRVGIVGYGKMGILHGALVNGTKTAKVVAVCDKSWVMRFGIKKVYPSVRTFKNIDEMLNKMALDVVIISTPTFNHVESAIKCLEKNCHVFVEKPLASTYEDAKKLYQIAKKNDKVLQVGYCARFAPSIMKGKELIDRNVIGKVKSGVAQMYIADVFDELSGWRYNKKLSGGGVLMDFGIHMVDQLCWYFGKINSVHADSKKLYSIEVEDELSADIEFEKGINIRFDTSWSKEEYRKSYSCVDLQGESGRMVITDQTVEVFNQNNDMIENYVYPDLYDGAYMDIGGLLYSKQMEYFFMAISGEKESNLESSVYDQYVVKKLYESSEQNKTIILD